MRVKFWVLLSAVAFHLGSLSAELCLVNLCDMSWKKKKMMLGGVVPCDVHDYTTTKRKK